MFGPLLKQLLENSNLPYARLSEQIINRYKAILVTRVLSGCEVIALPPYVKCYYLIKFLQDVFPEKKFILETSAYPIHEHLLFNEDTNIIYYFYEGEFFDNVGHLDVYKHNVCYLYKDYIFVYKGGDA